MNANLTLSEILTIAVVILIVFGPHRLPEMARRAGEMLAKVRQAAGAVRDEFSREMEEIKEAAAPLADLDKELKQAKAEIQQSLPKPEDLPSAADVHRTVNPSPASPGGAGSMPAAGAADGGAEHGAGGGGPGPAEAAGESGEEIGGVGGAA